MSALQAAPIAEFDATRLARVRQWADAYVQDAKLPGVGVLINVASHEVFSHFTGWRDVEDPKPFDRDTIARIFSMTKPITSVAIMQFVERGVLTLDTPLSDILPEFSDMTALKPNAKTLADVEPARAPTIHELLTHTCGLSYNFNEGLVPQAMGQQRIRFGPRSGRLSALCQKIATLPLAFQPGARWEYGVGIDVAGRVIEVLSGQTLDDYFKQNIFDPLGMDDTGFQVRADQVSQFANLYMPASGQDPLVGGRVLTTGLRRVELAERSNYLNPETLSGGGGLVGSIGDYMRFVEMLRLRGRGANGQILAPRTVDFMMQNHLAGDIADLGPTSFAEEPTTGMGFGLGGSVVTSPARTQTLGSVGDYSWGGIASTFFWLDRSLDMSVVFFTQLTPSSSYPVRPQLKALVHAALV